MTHTLSPMELAVSSATSVEGFDLRDSRSRLNLAAAMLTQEQVKNAVVHRFGGGVYIREAHYPKGTLVVGMEHKSEHLNMLLKGKINVMDPDGNVLTLVAPHMFVAKAGSKVGYVLEDTVWQNIYVTSSTDVEYLESLLFVIPEELKTHQEQKLFREYLAKDVERRDFISMAKSSGWSLEGIEEASAYRGDCVPFPDGSYSVRTADSPIHGRGLFASATISELDYIAPMTIGGKRTPAGYCVNHSGTPNAKAVREVNGDLSLVALRSIAGMVGGDLGEEITLDYRQVMTINNLWKGTTSCLLESH